MAAFPARPNAPHPPTAATHVALRVLARTHHQHLGDEIATLNVELEHLSPRKIIPELYALEEVSPDVAEDTPGSTHRNRTPQNTLRGRFRQALRRRTPAQPRPPRHTERPSAGPQQQPTGPTTPSGASSSVAAIEGIDPTRTTWPAESSPRASPRWRGSTASSATSHARSSAPWSPRPNSPGQLDKP